LEAIILSDWLSPQLHANAGEPTYRLLLRLMQHAILSGQLPPGMKLPSSRALATELAIARNTVVHVYDQLQAEGYVISSTGSGTYVADTRPQNVRRMQSVESRGESSRADAIAQRAQVRVARDEMSRRGTRLIDRAGVALKQWGAFMPGVPDVSEFPARTWSRLQARLWRNVNPDLLTYAPGGGYRPLRRALADYLCVARSVKCTAEQVIITTGIHQSIDLSVRLLADVGDRAWVEEPCYWGARSVLESGGLTLAPIPVDGEGMNPSARDLKSPPKVALVTPSHQYPLGMVMSLARRRALIEYARARRVWIIEDDYDSEFRYGSRPLASLQGLDDAGRVIYVGSVGKMLYPGIRIGYIVVPDHLIDVFRTGVAELYREGQLIHQAVLTEFILDGHLTTHVRRMRALYGERRQLLIDAITARFGQALPVMGDEAGLHLVLGLPPGTNDRAVQRAAFDAGVVVRELSNYYSDRRHAQPGMLLGYACVPNERIGPAFATLAGVIERQANWTGALARDA
jgi:GntR family transcriptional regulator / MocR family aminotransferase